MRASLGPLFIAVTTAASMLAPTRAHAQDNEPTVLIRVTDAYIAPRKANGAAWDGNDFIDSNVVSAAGAALGMANPWAALASALAPIANKVFQPPDVYGEVRLLRNGSEIPCRDGTPDCTVGVNLPKVQDNYIPVWDVAGLSIKLTDQIALKIRLADSDIPGEDPIGIIFIRADRLRTAAARNGVVTHFRIDDQTNGQAYYIGLSVFNQSAGTARATPQYQQPQQPQYQQYQQQPQYQQPTQQQYQQPVAPTYWSGDVAPAYVAATEPVYWNGRAHYYYNGYWMYRDGPRWIYYRTEPTYFSNWRSQYPNGRWMYRRSY